MGYLVFFRHLASMVLLLEEAKTLTLQIKIGGLFSLASLLLCFLFWALLVLLLAPFACVLLRVMLVLRSFGKMGKLHLFKLHAKLGFTRMTSTFNKISVPNPIVEMDGDEMTRIM